MEDDEDGGESEKYEYSDASGDDAAAPWCADSSDPLVRQAMLNLAVRDDVDPETAEDDCDGAGSEDESATVRDDDGREIGWDGDARA